MKKIINLWFVLGLALGLSIVGAKASPVEVKFTNVELNAGSVLVKPELNAIELHGQSGVFLPSPFLRAIGVGEEKFDIDFSGIADLANIQFNHLKGLTPTVTFEGSSLVLNLPVQDQSRAVTTRLGSISVRNVVLRAKVDWVGQANGRQVLVVSSTSMSGSMTGSGVLRPSFVINRVKNLILNQLNRVTARILNQPNTQESIQAGLLFWAKVSTGQEWRSVVPGRIQFYTAEASATTVAEAGLKYMVE